MARTSAKGGAMGLAMVLITAGAQMALGGDLLLEGGVLAVFGVVIAVGYQYVEDSDHEQVYNDVVAAIGEENLRELADLSADEIRRLKAQLREE